MIPIAKVFTLTRNETDLIESFLLYHGKLFGYENIIVIDNMSTCPVVKDVYYEYEKKGVTIVYETVKDRVTNGKIYTKHMLKYVNKTQFLIGIDTEEFIYIRGEANTINDIKGYLSSIPIDISIIKINTYFSAVPDVTSSSYVNQKVDNPAIHMTKFKPGRISPARCIFRACNFISTTSSCGGGRVKNGGDIYVSKRFVYFHYHNTGGRRSVEKAIDLVNFYNYTDTSKPITKQIENLLTIAKHVFIDKKRVFEYCLFLSKIYCLNYIIRRGKWPTNDKLCEIASDFHVIYNTDINLDKMENLPFKWELMYEQMLLKDSTCTKETKVYTNITTSILESIHNNHSIMNIKPIKKVALLLSGHLRNFSKRKEFWNDFNRKFGDRVDIYVHTWNETGVRSKTQWIDVGKDTPDFDEVRSSLRPKRMLIEDHSEKINSFSLKTPGLKLYYTNGVYLGKTNDFTRNIGSQLYSIMKAWELANESKNEYDMMIRLRNDCIIENFGNIFKRDTSFLEKNILVVNGNSHKHPHGGGGCNKCNLEYPVRKHSEHSNDVCDIMYLGNPKVMGRVCNMFNHSKDLILSFKGYNELALKDKEVRMSLVEYKGIYGIKNPKIYETKVKCFYPERLIREYMSKEWILTDMMGLVVRELYK